MTSISSSHTQNAMCNWICLHIFQLPFFQHKELKYHRVLFQTRFLSRSRSIKLGNRHGSCLGASTISNTVMLTHFYEGCVCSQWKTTLKTVRQMTNTQIRSVLVGGQPVLLLFSCHSWIPNSRDHFSKGSNVIWFEAVGCNLFFVYRLTWIDFKFLPGWLGLKPLHLGSLTTKEEKKVTVSVANC